MNKAVLGLAIGAAMTTSVALADGPVPLTDTQLDNVTAGGFGFVDFLITVQKIKLVDIVQNLNVNENVTFNVEGNGYLGFSEADANCFGVTDCKAETLTAVDVNQERFFLGEGLASVTSISESLAAAPSLSDLVTAGP